MQNSIILGGCYQVQSIVVILYQPQRYRLQKSLVLRSSVLVNNNSTTRSLEKKMVFHKNCRNTTWCVGGKVTKKMTRYFSDTKKFDLSVYPKLDLNSSSEIFNKNAPEQILFQHSLTEETQILLLTKYDLFSISNQGEIFNYSLQRDSDLMEEPIWRVYSNSITFQYFFSEKLVTKPYIARGYPFLYMETLLHCFLTYILLTQKNDATKFFFSKKISQIFPLLSMSSSDRLFCIENIVFLKELLSSYFSFLACPDNYYLWPDKKSSIFKAFFDVLFLPNIHRVTRTASSNPKDWSQEDDAFINILIKDCYLNVTYIADRKGTILKLLVDNKVYFVPILNLNKTANWTVDKDLNLIISAPIVRECYIDSAVIRIDGLCYDPRTNVVVCEGTENSLILEALPSSQTEFMLSCFREMNNILNTPEKSIVLTSISSKNDDFDMVYKKYNFPQQFIIDVKHQMKLVTNKNGYKQGFFDIYPYFTHLGGVFFLSGDGYNTTSFELLSSFAYFWPYLSNRFWENLYLIIILTYFWLNVKNIMEIGNLRFSSGKDFLNLLEKLILALFLPGGSSLHQLKPTYLLNFQPSFWTAKKIELSSFFSNPILNHIEKNPSIFRFLENFAKGNFSETAMLFQQMSYDEKLIARSIRKMFFYKIEVVSYYRTANLFDMPDQIKTYLAVENASLLSDLPISIALNQLAIDHPSLSDSSQPSVLDGTRNFFSIARADDSKMSELINSSYFFHTLNPALVNIIFPPSEDRIRTDGFYTLISNLRKNFMRDNLTLRYSFTKLEGALLDPTLLYGFDETVLNINKLPVPALFEKLFETKLHPVLKNAHIPQSKHSFLVSYVGTSEEKASALDSSIRKAIEKLNQQKTYPFFTPNISSQRMIEWKSRFLDDIDKIV